MISIKVLHTYVRHKMHSSFQCQYRYIETVGLWGELKIWVDINAPYSKCVGRQRFHGRINDIIAQGNVHLTWRCSGYAMTSCDDVSARYQRTATPENKQD